MTPTSPLAGVFTGLLDGSIIAFVVLLAVFLLNRRHHPARIVVHPVAEDLPRHEPDFAPTGNLHRAA